MVNVIEKLTNDINKIESLISNNICNFQNKYKLTFGDNDENNISDEEFIHINEVIDNNQTDNMINKINNTKKDQFILKSLLQYITCDKDETSDNNTMIKKCNWIFSIFKAKYVTNIIEDNTWTLYNKDTYKYNNIYKIKDNEIYFENTLSFVDSENEDCLDYLDNIVKLFNKIFTNFTFKYKIIDSKVYGISFIVIRAKKVN